MMRRSVLAALVGVLAFSPLAVARSSAAAEASITQVGWWTRNPAASAPADGFNVSNAADGPVAVAALKVSSSTGLTSAALILTEEGGIQADSAKLQVCTTPNEWTAGAAQAYADAPKAECDSGSAEMTRNPASGTWAADVTSLVADIEDDGSVSLMVVPAGDAAVPVAFEVRLQKPQFTSEAEASSSSSSSSSSDVDFASTGSSAGDSSSSESPTSGDASGSVGNNSSGSTMFAPSSFDTTAPVAPVASTTADGAAGASDATPPVAEAPASDASSTAEIAALPTQADLGVTSSGGKTAQAIWFVLMATVAGVGAGGGRYVARRRATDPDAFA